MIKSELITKVAEQLQKPEHEVEEMLNAALNNITTALAQGERVTLAKFGRFEMRCRQPKLFVNPNTDEVHQLEEMMIPCFKASNILKETIASAQKSTAQ